MDDFLIPPFSGADIGSGVDRTGNIRPSPFKPIPETEKLNSVMYIDCNEVSIVNSEDFAQKIQFVTGVSTSAWRCEAATNFCFEKTKCEKNTALQLIIYCRLTYPAQLVDRKSLKLREDAEEILKTKGSHAFFENFGEYFIVGYKKGVSGSVNLMVKDNESSRSLSRSGDLDATVKSCTKIQVNGDFDQSMKKNNLSYNFKSYFSGIDKTKENSDYESSVESAILLTRNLHKYAKNGGDVLFYVVVHYRECPAFFTHVLKEEHQGTAIGHDIIQKTISQELLQLRYLLMKYEGNRKAESQIYEALDDLLQNESKITLKTLSQYKKASAIEKEYLSRANKVVEIGKKIIKYEDEGKFRFAIDANVTLKDDYIGTCKVKEMEGFVITEQGTGRCFIYPYQDIELGVKAAKSWYCCWVAYDREGEEIDSWGIFAKQTCRWNGLNWLKKNLPKLSTA